MIPGGDPVNRAAISDEVSPPEVSLSGGTFVLSWSQEPLQRLGVVLQKKKKMQVTMTKTLMVANQRSTTERGMVVLYNSKFIGGMYDRKKAKMKKVA